MICKNKRCQKELPDEFKFCPYCGRDQRQKQRTRRANGEGSIYQTPDGRWRVDLVVKYSVDEKGNLRSVRATGIFPTKAAAAAAIPELRQRKLDELQRLADAQSAQTCAQKRRYTVADCWDIYLHSQAYERLSKSQKTKLGIARRRIQPLEDRPIDTLLLDDMQNLIDATVSTFYPAKDMKTVFSHCYSVALKRDLVSANKSQYLELPLLNESERPAFSEQELETFRLDYANGNKFTGYILILCYAGLRPGELMDIKLENIHLNEGYMIGGGKTEAGTNRTIPIADVIRPVVEYFSGKNRKKLLEMNKDRFYARYWETIDRLGVSQLSPYSCRHTFMTMLALRGVQPGIITAAGGHTDYQTTLRYTHVPVDDMLKAVNLI